MRNQPMSTTYIVVLGLEAVTAYLLGILMLHEGSSPAKLAGQCESLRWSEAPQRIHPTRMPATMTRDANKTPRCGAKTS
jgi:hypothetical protein